MSTRHTTVTIPTMTIALTFFMRYSMTAAVHISMMMTDRQQSAVNVEMRMSLRLLSNGESWSCGIPLIAFISEEDMNVSKNTVGITANSIAIPPVRARDTYSQ